MTNRDKAAKQIAALEAVRVNDEIKILLRECNDRLARTTIELDIPETAEEREALRITGGWDRWYANLPDDLRRKLSIYDFKRLGDVFRQAFDIPDTKRPFDWGKALTRERKP